MIKKCAKCCSVLFWLFLALSPLYSQVTHSHSIVIGFLQLKDRLNLGMVFNGVQLEYRYGLLWKARDHEVRYQPKLGAGVAFNRGMTGYQVHVSPLSVTWAKALYEENGHTLKGGINIMSDYNYQAYPSLHDAHLFWTGETGFSPVIDYSYQWDTGRIHAQLHNSLFGLSSHIQQYDPHFYSNTVMDFLVKPHTNMKAGSFNHYNHTNVSVEFVPNISKIHSFVYEFDYLGFFSGNRFDRIHHNLLWRMSL